MDRVVIGPSAPAPHSTLSRDHIDVWLFRMSTKTAAWVDSDDLLSDDERRRAASYLRDEDRMRFIIGRAGLRMVLASYLGVDARSLSFAARSNGKPILTAPAATSVQFSISHSGGLVACAVGCEREIGIDVEYTPRLRALADDAHVFLSAVEEHALTGVVGPQREQRLSEYWTLKEAFLKATGEGLRSDLRRLTFEIGPDLSCRCATVGRPDAQNWEFRLLRPVTEYTIAVCVERGASPLHLKVREFIPTKPRKKSAV